ncbi:LexA family transcriptional regulator [Taibaiella lutea]|uniref:LexA family transcriptional regulator n=1 Tax=Taibaiella lutea TaxID=2608001 RepID=A0A5M6CFT0_9BACT|nr:helix-turn-helix domain-containing protein [Taibaiella lutea]KAA5532305.1 LexA family transcriptional regulator [Taibaiella lutea]
MISQQNFWPTNLKKLRNRKNMSQESLALLLNMSRSKYNAHESGQTVNPVVEDLFRISDYFGMSIDSLLRVDLTKLSESKIRELEEGNDLYRKGTQLRVLSVTVDKNDTENVEYVPVKAKAGYRNGFSDPEFIAALPKFSMPNLPKSAMFRMFPTTGDSMLPIPEGADVIGSFVQDWTNIKPRTMCIVILKGEQDMVFKQVTQQDEGFLLESLNTVYQPYTVPASDVLEIWKFYSYQTNEIPEQQTDLQTMAKAIKEIRDDLKIMKTKK